MELYIVSEICDYEYYCTKVLFVTDNEQVAIDYCNKYNKHFVGWDGKTELDTVTYQQYTLNNLP